MNALVKEGCVRTILDFLSCGKTVQYLDRADVIFLFGGFRLTSPAIEAARLWVLKYAPYILVSGGPANSATTKHVIEADHYAEVLQQNGVPNVSIIRERLATNTLENVRFGLEAIRLAGITCRSIIAVSKPAHVRRCLATLSKYAPRVSLTGYRYSEPNWRYPDNTSDERLVGEVERLVSYGERGDISQTAVPRDVIRACRQLHPTTVL